MKKIFFVFFLLIAVIGIDAKNAEHHYFGSVNLKWHDRSAIYDFGKGQTQRDEMKTLSTIGIGLGKRYFLSEHFRLLFPFTFDAGRKKETTFYNVMLENRNVVDADVNATYYMVGLVPELQLVAPLNHRTSSNISIGGGMHYVKKKEVERAGNMEILDPNYLESHGGIRWSMSCGAGIETVVNPKLSLAFQYTFRYWHPVKGETNRGLFPFENVDYKERFLSHGVTVYLFFGQ